jgi:hypothetical protein
MLLNLNKKSWIDGLRLQDYNDHCRLNEQTVKTMLELANNYNKALEEEEKMTPEQLAIKNVGKLVGLGFYFNFFPQQVILKCQVLKKQGPQATSRRKC